MVEGGGGGDVREVGAVEVYACKEALGCEVGEVDGCVDADGGEGGGVGEVLGVGRGEEGELWEGG